ncbi:MAG: alanine:cation symporter family protein [Proteobacteria bacterium]|nr:alanine:cation symporter family protein [Pseudomonadota bacterium]
MTSRVLAALLALALLVGSPAAPGSFVSVAHARQGDEAASTLNEQFGRYLVAPFKTVLFWDVVFWDNGREGETELPIIVLWLISGALFFTLRMRFINLRAFSHALVVTAGRYDDPSEPGEVSHFRALASALSATVGLGNIAGVAIAVGTGGPGATFWMILAGFLGMSSKFVECTLGQMFREVDSNGRVLGGPMRYLSAGLSELGMPRTGTFLAILFSLLCIGASFAGGNIFQSNQSYQMTAEVIPFFRDNPTLYGLLMVLLVGIVIVGGIRRIGAVAGYIVPVMCGVYVVAGVWILLSNVQAIPGAFGRIFSEAFTPQAGYGGFLGVLVTGVRRAAFSNEAGIGSAAIAHSAAATSEPVREGIVALLEPFIDTVVICTMTALVVIVTGTYTGGYGEGVNMTSAAFASVLPWFPNVLSLAVFFFAFSTMISWSYYGERCWTHVFGARTSIVYKLLFLVFTFIGPLITLGHVVDFGDVMVFGMAFPNMLGAVLLAPKVRDALDDYWTRLKTGAMTPASARNLAAGEDPRAEAR